MTLGSGLLRVVRQRRLLLLWSVLLSGWVSVTTLDATLAAMHGIGQASGGPAAVAVPWTAWAPAGAGAVVEGWASWSPAVEGIYRSAGRILAIYAAADLLLVAAPIAVLLYLGLVSATNRAVSAGGSALELGDVAGRLTLVLPMTFLLADVVEDLTLRIAFVLTDRGTAGTPAASLQVVGGASLVKWLALLVALATIGFTVLSSRRALRDALRAAGFPAPRPRIAPALLALRAQVAILTVCFGILLLLPGDIGRQVGDVVLDLPAHAWSRGLLALGTVALLSVAMGVTGVQAVRAYLVPPLPAGSLSLRRLIVIGGAGVVVIIAGALAARQGWSPGWVLVAAGGLAALFSLLSGVIDRDAAVAGYGGLIASPNESESEGKCKGQGAIAPEFWPDTARSLLPWLAAGPLLAFAAACVRGAVILETVSERAAAAGLVSFAVASLVVALALVGPSAAERYDLALIPAPATQRAWIVSAIVALLIAVPGGAAPHALGTWGSLAVVFLFLAALLAAASAAVLLGDRHRPRGVLSYARLQRMPYLALALLVFAGSSALNRDGRYHDVQLLDRPSADSVQLRQAFTDWTSRQVPEAATDGRPRVPMVFVAAAGGGIRAAYWTSIALDCLAGRLPDLDTGKSACAEVALPDGAFGSFFVTSGISGGSVGLAAFRAAGDGATPTHQIFQSRDFLAPNLAAFAFRDLPNGFLHADDPWPDRAAVLEEAWVRAEPGLGEGLSASAHTSEGELRFPLLLLSGATVDGGCRMAGSVIDLAPGASHGEVVGPVPGCTSLEATAEPDAGGWPMGAAARTRDVGDFTCHDQPNAPRDLSLAAAAHLSARFPYVSPSGSLTACAGGDTRPRTFVLDGGIIESSGAGALVDLWGQVGPLIHAHNADPSQEFCIAPRLLLIDNGYVDTSAQPRPRRPQELLAPAQAVGAARDGTTPAARQSAALAFQTTMGASVCVSDGADEQQDLPSPSAADAVDAVAHLYPTLHPGPVAPLGWVLSSWSERDLRTELLSTDNLSELRRVRSWFGS